MSESLRYGMVGGGLQAFIGEVHRKALAFDPRARLVGGCFSSREDRNLATAAHYGLDARRVYPDYEGMARAEGARADGIDFVVIVTPNHLHYRIAKCFLEAGIHVVCEKPLCFSSAEAAELEALAEEKGLLLAVSYAYTGYAMVKLARRMLREGRLGRILSVQAEYAQDWLLASLDRSEADAHIAAWRREGRYSGISNCVADIGSHVENLVHYVSGLPIRRLLATLNRFGHELELNADIMVEFPGPVYGHYWCSQLAAGRANGLMLRIYGSEGSLEWEQHQPDYLRYTPKGEAPRLLARGCACPELAGLTAGRLPAGHPEGLYVAFANFYREVLDALAAGKSGELPGRALRDFADVGDGLRGMRFVEAVVSSADRGGAWVELPKA